MGIELFAVPIAFLVAGLLVGLLILISPRCRLCEARLYSVQNGDLRCWPTCNKH